MTTCPSCQRRIGRNAKTCPGCHHDFDADRQKKAREGVVAMIMAAVIAAVALFVLLLPGIIINICRGRYKHRSGNLVMTAIRDWQTWLIALPISFIVFMILTVAGAFDPPRKTSTHSSAVDATLSAPQSQAITGSSNTNEPPIEIRKALPASESPSGLVPFAETANSAPPPDLPPSSQSLRPIQNTLIVVGVASEDYLNVRTAPAMNSTVCFKLTNGNVVQIDGKSVYNGNTEWVPIAFGTDTGWVSSKYLRPNIQ